MATTTNDHDDGVGPAPFTPSEEWIEAFDRQNTDDMRQRAQRFARSRARFVARAGGRGDDLYAAELVHDALTDTLFGVLSWDPAVVSLEAHVFGAVRFRTKNDRQRALRFRHQSIDAGDAAGVMCEVETTLAAVHNAPSIESLAFSAQVLDQVRDLAADDSAILRIVDAVAQGACAPREIMSVAEMSEKTWRKARLRLARLVERLSNHALLGARSHA
jgi:hypothetical protein